MFKQVLILRNGGVFHVSRPYCVWYCWEQSLCLIKKRSPSRITYAKQATINPNAEKRCAPWRSAGLFMLYSKRALMLVYIICIFEKETIKLNLILTGYIYTIIIAILRITLNKGIVRCKVFAITEFVLIQTNTSTKWMVFLHASLWIAWRSDNGFMPLKFKRLRLLIEWLYSDTL